ncbi:uncharacterized protein L969DRAFT_28270, partial [Mixia osmundae IAM 14324]|uniref:uncharacterized protein n=1 Tax=Mixia osmundae (strain CBS 9802 / IAM 14324 / JCM 22182 / KY 12970) TaxID=764103 RepID=UPI0004A558A9
LRAGCQTKYKDEHDGSVRVCPRCHNPSIAAVKQTDIFEFCYIPLIPYSSSHLWQCSICR